MPVDFLSIENCHIKRELLLEQLGYDLYIKRLCLISKGKSYSLLEAIDHLYQLVESEEK